MKKLFTLPNIILFLLNVWQGYILMQKLSGQTDLSWWLVLAPLWIAPVAVVGAFTIAGLFLFQAAAVNHFLKLFKNE